MGRLSRKMTCPLISLKAKAKVRCCPDGDGMGILPGIFGYIFFMMDDSEQLGICFKRVLRQARTINMLRQYPLA